MSDSIRIEGESRFSRFSLISWWDQARLAEGRVLIVGAGALGNEVVKNLSLLGVGRIAVCDMDTIELSNLSRAVLFREKDRGRPKAEVACESARSIYPDIGAVPISGNVVHGIGLGVFRWAGVVIGAVDNREARLSINRWCSLVGRPWIDGGIEVLAGIARVFVPDGGACYECTLSETDWQILERRRACTLLPRGEGDEEPRVPTTPTTASIVAGIQCAEALKILHGIEGLAGEGFQFDGKSYDSYRVRYARDPECYGHETLPSIEESAYSSSATTVGELIDEFRRRLGKTAIVEACRELLAGFRCAACGSETKRPGALGAISAAEAICGSCGEPAAPILYHRLDAPPCDSRLTLREIGLPAWDIVRGHSDRGAIALEISGDRAGVLPMPAER